MGQSVLTSRFLRGFPENGGHGAGILVGGDPRRGNRLPADAVPTAASEKGTTAPLTRRGRMFKINTFEQYRTEY